MTQHTPTPWRYEEELRAQQSMITGGHWVIAGIPNETWNDAGIETQRANAAFIVTACNAYDADQERIAALVATLEVIIDIACAPESTWQLKDIVDFCSAALEQKESKP